MPVRDWVMLLLLLLLLSVTLPPVHPLLEDHPDEAEAGSGCEDAANYFDYIGVDDEDYVSEEEGSTDQFESLIRGPPVFTDSEDDEVSDETSVDLHDKTGEREVYQDRTRPPPSPPPRSGQIIPESLVIKNRTHAKLNGNLIITNNEDQEEQGPELYFEEQKHSEEEQEVKEILIESLGSKMSISVLCIFIIIMLL